ncbi:hypothetical protein BKA66DRAFT_444244 [Pyrenochaeta sp. MPI-SDFR-AT-0127]|nr:hypothetical protein BKA66DRAFT_444244 [Pyrenochaeta sp. MPI-SDFR-AT-0127]
MAELAFATVTVLKEVYLLSRFVARTARSASHSSTEREALQNELEFEHLYIRSFGLLFFQSDGVFVPHERLNEDWLKKIRWILDGLRLAQGDYAKLAAERDEVYGKMSPFLKEHGEEVVQEDGRLIEFVEFDREAKELELHPQNVTGLQIGLGAMKQYSSSCKKSLFPSKDWRWALSEKKHLERILATSQGWTGKLKELVQLTMAINQHHQIPGPLTNLSLTRNENARRLGLSGHAKLRQNIQAAPTDISDLELKDSTVELPKQRTTLTPALLQSSDGLHSVLVETKPLPENVSEDDERNVLRLAELLALSSGTDLSTIPLQGVLRIAEENAYAFVFNYPSDVTDAPPITLFELIRRPHSVTPGLSLAQRFRVAQSIAKSLNALHADGWVHKSFRSRSIVFFRDPDGNLKEKPYLVDFEYSRSTNTNTSWTYDDDVEKNLYRHPLRQRPPQKSFNQVYDLYALGVVLLEIGLWRTISSIKEQAQATLEPGNMHDPETLSESYINTANRDLKHTMGEAYADAVVTCLKGSFGVAVTKPSFALVVYDLVIQKLDPKRLLDVY